MNEQVPIEIAIIEHLAERLEIPEYNLILEALMCEQKAYLQTLIMDAFIIKMNLLFGGHAGVMISD